MGFKLVVVDQVDGGGVIPHHLLRLVVELGISLEMACKSLCIWCSTIFACLLSLKFVCLLFYNGKSGSVIIRRHPPNVTLPLKRQHKKVIHILNRPCIVIIRLEQVNKITVIITISDIVTVLITISVIVTDIVTVSMSVLSHGDGRHLTGYHHLFTAPATPT